MRRLKHIPIVLYTGAFNAPNLMTELKSLAHTFNFQLTEDLSSPAWNYALFPDQITAITPHLLNAMARQATIVRFDYFSQLRLGNTFHEGLVQPAVTPGLFFTGNHLLARQSRKFLLAEALSSVRYLICLNEKHFQLLSALQLVLGKCSVTSTVPATIPYCDLIVVGEAELHNPPIKLSQRSRFISIDSIVEAFILSNDTLLRIESLEPEPIREVSVIETGNEIVNDSVAEIVNEIVNESVISGNPSTQSTPLLSSLSSTSIQASRSNSSSLVLVESIPQSFLRNPPHPHSTSLQSKNTKRFVKCHPITRAPQSIPALLGPDQLRLTTNNTINNNTTKSAPKRDDQKKRILVRDDWLAEDGFAEGQPVRIVKLKPVIERESENIMVNSRKPVENMPKQSSPSELKNPIGATKPFEMKSSNEALNLNETMKPTTNPPSSTTPRTTTTPPTSTSTSAFKSSFFQNLQRPK